MRAVVSFLVHGAPNYFEVAREAVTAVLARTDFDVFVAYEGDATRLPRSSRITLHTVSKLPAGAVRPYRFLLKFEALAACLAAGSHDFIVQMDTDALPVRRLTAGMIADALGPKDFGMVEQKTVTGSTMNRDDFLQHYAEHALPVIAPRAPVPALAQFRYFNSGIVIGRRAAFSALVTWAREHIKANLGRHEVGQHMVADQDYFQIWANTLHPGSCVELPWYWNHCEHWDTGFLRSGTLVAHFSNFCLGPTDNTPTRMRALRTPLSVVRHTLAGNLYGYR